MSKLECPHIWLQRIVIGGWKGYKCDNPACGDLFVSPEPFKVGISSGVARSHVCACGEEIVPGVDHKHVDAKDSQQHTSTERGKE
jgi:hypothetical protein